MLNLFKTRFAASEVSKLNVEIEILKAANDEKDKRIQDMQQSMGHFKKVGRQYVFCLQFHQVNWLKDLFCLAVQCTKLVFSFF